MFLLIYIGKKIMHLICLKISLHVCKNVMMSFTGRINLTFSVYRHLMKSCSHPSMQPARCYELFVVYAQPVSDSLMQRQNRVLVSEVTKLFDSIQAPPPFLMFWSGEEGNTIFMQKLSRLCSVTERLSVILLFQLIPRCR